MSFSLSNPLIHLSQAIPGILTTEGKGQCAFLGVLKPWLLYDIPSKMLFEFQAGNYGNKDKRIFRTSNSVMS